MPTSHQRLHTFETPWPTTQTNPLYVSEAAFAFMRKLRSAPSTNADLAGLPQMQVAVTQPTPNQPEFRVTYKFDGPLTHKQIALIMNALDDRERVHRAAHQPGNASDA